MTSPLTDEQLKDMLAGCSGVTPGPYEVCRHLESLEADEACTCGYRGGVWGARGEILIFEMGTDPYHEGWEMVPVADRPTQLRDAAHFTRCDPQTISSIITELLELRGRSAVLNEWTGRLQAICEARGALGGDNRIDFIERKLADQAAELLELRAERGKE